MSDELLNILLIFGVVVVFIIIAILVINKVMSNSEKSHNSEILELPELTEGVKASFTEILRMDIASLNLNRNALQQVQRNNKALRLAYKNCSLGDLGSKEYIKEYIKNMLEKKFGINEETIDRVIPFHDNNMLSIQDKSEILLNYYKELYHFAAFDKMVSENNMIEDDPEKGYVITKEKVEEVFDNVIGYSNLTYPFRLEILAQRIYQRIKGNSVVDSIRDMMIDGVSGGVSGIPVGLFDYDSASGETPDNMTYSYDSIFVMFHGMSVHLEYMSFGSQKELERVCKNVYRYENPGQLSKSKPYCIGKMADGSRVVVTRPDFSDSWMFFIRKFDTADARNIEDLIPDKNANVIINAIRFALIGEQTMFITGMQATGKTTLLRAVMKFVRRSFNIRVQEMAFELWLRKTFGFTNVATFQEGAVSGQDGLDIQKKTDGDLNILGEIATTEQFGWAVQTSGTASRFTLATQHSLTTPILMNSAASALMQCYGYHSEKYAMERAVQAIRFDLHVERNISGKRYIERLTEIVPGKELGEYTIRNIVEWKDGEYILVNPYSDGTTEKMLSHMTQEEKDEFHLFMKGVERCA